MRTQSLYHNVSKSKATKPSTISPSSEGVYVADATYQNNKVKSTKKSSECCYSDRSNNMDSAYSILLTREELAARWKYCVETLKRWEKAGKLPFIQLGKEIRYRLSVIMAIEENSEVAV
jgi:hypothetical protein